MPHSPSEGGPKEWLPDGLVTEATKVVKHICGGAKYEADVLQETLLELLRLSRKRRQDPDRVATGDTVEIKVVTIVRRCEQRAKRAERKDAKCFQPGEHVESVPSHYHDRQSKTTQMFGELLDAWRQRGLSEKHAQMLELMGKKLKYEDIAQKLEITVDQAYYLFAKAKEKARSLVTIAEGDEFDDVMGY